MYYKCRRRKGEKSIHKSAEEKIDISDETEGKCNKKEASKRKEGTRL